MLVPKKVGVKNRRAGKTANGNIGVEDGMKGSRGRRGKMSKAHHANNRWVSASGLLNARA